LEKREAKLNCPFCGSQRKATIALTERGEFFLEDIDRDGREELENSLTCVCGAEWFIGDWKMPKEYTVHRAAEGIAAAKQMVEIKEVELKGKKQSGIYRWNQIQLRFPKHFRMVKPGRYVVYHQGREIILKPVAVKPENRSATP
jgi:hypothetical protein